MSLLPPQTVQVHIPETLPSATTTQLLLRPLAASDAADLFAIRSRPEVAKTNHPKTPHRTIEETREWMAITEGPETIIGRHFTYVLVGRGDDDGKAIGYVSINEVYPSPEIGYSIHPDCWGKGYATEAVEKLVQMWWDLPRPRPPVSAGGEREKVFALCEKGNLGSSRVLTKCGFMACREVVYGEDELCVWELERRN